MITADQVVGIRIPEEVGGYTSESGLENRHCGACAARTPRLGARRAPWQDACSESSSSRFRDEFFDQELFSGTLTAWVFAERYRVDYNISRRHGSLRGGTPVYLTPLCMRVDVLQREAEEAAQLSGGRVARPHTLMVPWYEGWGQASRGVLELHPANLSTLVRWRCQVSGSEDPRARSSQLLPFHRLSGLSPRRPRCRARHFYQLRACRAVDA